MSVARKCEFRARTLDAFRREVGRNQSGTGTISNILMLVVTPRAFMREREVPSCAQLEIKYFQTREQAGKSSRGLPPIV